MTSRSLLVLSLITVALGLGAVAFFLLDSDDAVETVSETAELGDAPDRTSRVPDSAGVERTDADLEDSGPVEAERQEDILREHLAQWTEGRIPRGSLVLAGQVLSFATGGPVDEARVEVWVDTPVLEARQMPIGQALRSGGDPAESHSYGRFGGSSSRSTMSLFAYRDRPFREMRCTPAGTFRFDDLPEDVEFYLLAFAEGLRSPLLSLELEAEQHQVDREDLILRLEPCSQVMGLVRDPDGEPIAGATVTLDSPRSPFDIFEGGMTIRDDAETTSDDGGRFRFEHVPAGVQWTVQASLDPFAPSKTAEFTSLVAETSHVELTLSASASLSVVVLTTSGAAVEGAEVSLAPAEFRMDDIAARARAFDAESDTDSEGHAELTGVPPGKYRVVASHSDYRSTSQSDVELGPGETRILRLELTEGAVIQGTVVDVDDEPIAEADVEVQIKPSLMNFARLMENDERSTETDAKGVFRVAGLGSGPWLVTVEASGFATSVVEIGTDDDAPVIRLSRNGSIQGIVLSRVHGRAVKEFSIMLRGKDPELDALSGFTMGFNPSDLMRRPYSFESEQGKFEVTDVPPGQWTLEVVADEHAPFETEPVEVVAGEARGGVLCYLTAGSAISGLVVDESSTPIAGASITASVGRSSPIQQVMQQVLGGSGIETDDDGQFHLRGLKPGQYRLTVTHPLYASKTVSKLEVGAGRELSDLTVVLDSGGVIYGTVFDQPGRPAAGARIFANEPLTVTMRSVRSDESGEYSFIGLLPGQYQLWRMPDSLSLSETMIQEMTTNLQMASVRLKAGERVRVDLGGGEAGSAVLTGTVRENGAGKAGAFVSVIGHGETASGMSGAKSAVTDESGSFRFERLKAGPALVQVRTSLDPRSAMSGGLTRRIELEVNKITRCDLEIPSGSITGRVVDASSGAAVAGVPVYASREDTSAGLGLEQFAQRRIGYLMSNSDGSFALEHLPPGMYSVTAGGSDLVGIGEVAYALTRRSGIGLAEGRNTDVGSIALSPPLEVAGSVVDSQGRSVTGASVFLRRADGTFLEMLSSTSSDAAGEFVYRGVPAGDYDVLVRSSGLATATVAVSIGPGGASPVEVTLLSGTEVILVLSSAIPSDVSDFHLEITGPQGRIPLGLLGLAELATIANTLHGSKEVSIGVHPAGRYRVECRLAGETFAVDVELRGEPELRIPVSGPND